MKIILVADHQYASKFGTYGRAKIAHAGAILAPSGGSDYALRAVLSLALSHTPVGTTDQTVRGKWQHIQLEPEKRFGFLLPTAHPKVRDNERIQQVVLICTHWRLRHDYELIDVATAGHNGGPVRAILGPDPDYTQRHRDGVAALRAELGADTSMSFLQLVALHIPEDDHFKTVLARGSRSDPRTGGSQREREIGM